MNASINVGISSVNKFFEYLQQIGKPTPENLEYVEERYKPRNILTLNEINHLIRNHPPNTPLCKHGNQSQTRSRKPKGQGNAKYLLWLWIRKSEGINLKINDILTERKLIHVRKGKGSKERYVPVTGNNLNHITEYLKTAGNIF